MDEGGGDGYGIGSINGFYMYNCHFLISLQPLFVLFRIKAQDALFTPQLTAFSHLVVRHTYFYFKLINFKFKYSNLKFLSTVGAYGDE